MGKGKNPLPDRSRPQVQPQYKLVSCPRGCGTDVQAGQVGNPHQYGRLVDGEIVQFTCKD